LKACEVSFKFAVSSIFAADFSPELKDLIAKANSEGKLHVSWSESSVGGSQGAKKIQAAMNDMFGTKIKITFSPGRSMAAMSSKIRAEAAAGTPASSNVYLGPAPFAAPMVKRKVLIKRPWPKYLPGRITDEISEADGALLRVATALGGVTYNTKLMPGKEKPTRMSDFLKPGWKGKIASTPYAASFDTLSANGAWGPKKTTEYVRKLSSQIRGLIRCGEGERIATGEFIALVMDCNSAMARKWTRRGAPVEQMIPIDAATKRQFYMGVPTNSSNQYAATLYAVFLNTREGQKILWTMWDQDNDAFPESETRKMVAALEKKGAKFTNATYAFQKAHPEINKAKKGIVKILKSTRKKKKR